MKGVCMNILWVVNIIVSDMADALGNASRTVFGGWIEAAARVLSEADDVQLTLLASGNVKKIERRDINGITYIVVPESSSRMKLKPRRLQESYCRSILNDQQPDCIHIQGTEYPLGLGVLAENAGRCPVFVSIQGILPLCVREYYCGLFETSHYRNSSLVTRMLTRLPIAIQRKRLADRLDIEHRYLEQSNYICGRTDCDRAYVLREQVQSQIRGEYIYSGELLRETFYQDSWALENCERHSIFIGNTSYSLKGFHHLLEAVSMLVKKYPDIHIYAAGDSHQPGSLKDFRHRVGYSYYINKMVRAFGLSSRITFTGILTDEEVKKRMLSSHVSVVCSSAENSPNTLGEAMMLGVPSVVSYAGGMPSMADDGIEVLFYPKSDAVMMAAAIDTLWGDDERARKISAGSRERARKNHHPDHIKKLAESYRTAWKQMQGARS